MLSIHKCNSIFGISCTAVYWWSFIKFIQKNERSFAVSHQVLQSSLLRQLWQNYQELSETSGSWFVRLLHQYTAFPSLLSLAKKFESMWFPLWRHNYCGDGATKHEICQSSLFSTPLSLPHITICLWFAKNRM